MIYLIGVLILVVGFIIGYKLRELYENFTLNELLQNGLLVIKTEDGWQGIKEAFNSISLSRKSS